MSVNFTLDRYALASAVRQANGQEEVYSELFTNLYSTYQPYVYRCCMKILKNEADAEDVAQTCFLKLWESFPTYKGESKFSTWLYRFVTNECMLHLRKARTEPVAKWADVDQLKIVRLHSIAPTQERACIAKMDVDRYIRTVPVGYRNVLILKAVGYEHGEIGRIFNINPNTVRSQFYRGRRYMQQQFQVAA